MNNNFRYITAREYRTLFLFGPHLAGRAPASLPSPADIGEKGFCLSNMFRVSRTVSNSPEIPVGFIIRASTCQEYHRKGRTFPEDFTEELRSAIRWLESRTARRFGCGPRPLLLAITDSSGESSSGTILNLGITPSLVNSYENSEFFWKTFSDFIHSFGTEICGIYGWPSHSFPSERDKALSYLEYFRAATGREFPREPVEILEFSIMAFFDFTEKAKNQPPSSRSVNSGSGAMILQVMYPVSYSGSLLTLDPADDDENKLLITVKFAGEAGPSLGGSCIYLDRNNLEILAPQILISSEKERIIKLARTAIAFEQELGHPLKIKWGCSGEKIIFFQAGRIPGLELAREIKKTRNEEIERLRRSIKYSEKKDDSIFWVAHDLGESINHPSPLTVDIIERFMAGPDGFLKFCRRLGYHPSPSMENPGLLEWIAGKPYISLAKAASLFYGNLPFEYSISENEKYSKVFLSPRAIFRPEKASPFFLFKLPFSLLALFHRKLKSKKIAKHFLDSFETEILPAFQKRLSEFSKVELTSLTLEELVAEFARREKLFHDFGIEVLTAGFFASYYTSRLIEDLSMIFGEAEAEEMASVLLSSLENSIYLDMTRSLYEVSKGRLEFEIYLSKFGHRGQSEYELASKRWREEPSFLLNLLRIYCNGSRSPNELYEETGKKRKELEKKLSAHLSSHGAGCLEKHIHLNLQAARKFLSQREYATHYEIKILDLMREVIELLAERSGIGQDIYFLKRYELDEIKSKKSILVSKIPERVLRWRAIENLSVPLLLSTKNLENIKKKEGCLNSPRVNSSPSLFEGSGLAPGFASGRTRIVSSSTRIDELKAGDILVLHSADASWAPFIPLAGGLIIEHAGFLSHISVIAREFGIPCVALENATALLAGQIPAEIDGIKGTVKQFFPEQEECT